MFFLELHTFIFYCHVYITKFKNILNTSKVKFKSNTPKAVLILQVSGMNMCILAD